MDYANYFKYLVYGSAGLLTLIVFVRSGHLWKPRFFKPCFVASLICGALGIVLEVTRALAEPTGATLVITFIPLFFLSWFQFNRWAFKRWKGTEPYITDLASVVGGKPLDLFASENKDGITKKFSSDRRIMTEDFAFTFSIGLIPALTILLAIAFVYGRC